MNYKTLKRTLDSAIAFQNASQFDEAEKLYAQVRREAPKLYDGWYLSGTLAFQRGGHLEQAVEFLTRAQRIDPNAPQCKLFLGMALADLGRYAEAEKPLRAALLKLPGYPETWQSLGACHWFSGSAVEAIECLRRASALAPGNSEIRDRLDEYLLGSPDSTLGLACRSTAP